jgi:predicted transcriptional regulator
MDTLIKPKTTANDLNDQIKEHLEELAKATDEARVSEEMVRYLDFVRSFINTVHRTSG